MLHPLRVMSLAAAALVAACSQSPRPVVATPPTQPAAPDASAAPADATPADATPADAAPPASAADNIAYGQPGAPRAPERPCAIEATVLQPDLDTWSVMLNRVQPEGSPLRVGYRGPYPMRFEYDASGRIVRSPDATYTYPARGPAIRVAGNQRQRVTFDAAHHLTSEPGSRYRYDAQGRLTRIDSQPYYLSFEHHPDGTYSTGHNHPDRDEVCEPSLSTVRHDAQARPVFDRYEDCAISEAPVTLRYRYEGDHIDRIMVDIMNDDVNDVELRLSYSCAAPTPAP